MPINCIIEIDTMWLWHIFLFVACTAAVCNNECNVTLTFPVDCPVHSNTTTYGTSSIKQCQCEQGFAWTNSQCVKSSGINVGLVAWGAFAGSGAVGYALWAAMPSTVQLPHPLAGVKINV